MSDKRYGVILDAGSSGTRVHVYTWRDPIKARKSASSTALSNLPVLSTRKEWTKKVQPGLSSFGDRPDRVGPDHLEDLVRHAKSHIPETELPNTPIFLLATAGMRLLPEPQRKAIMDQVCSYLLSATSFSLPHCGQYVQVIPGEAEGLYGWIAANYLLGGFDAPSKAASDVHDKRRRLSTYGFLEMGGASAQIAFAPNATESRKHADDLKLLRLRTLGGESKEYRVFVTTWLGYGVQEARRRYLDALVKAHSGAKRLVDPCLPTGLKTTLAGDIVTPSSRTPSDTGAEIVGRGTFTECLKRTFPLLDKDAPCEDEPCLVHGIHTPAIDFDVNHFVGTSEFWYSTHGIFGNEDGEDKVDKAYDLHTYQKKVEAFCNQDWRAIRKQLTRNKYGTHVSENDVIGVCFKASWIINMLHDGIGVPRVGLEPLPDLDAGDGDVNGTEALRNAARRKGFLDTFRAVDKVNDVELSWTLGRMLLYASSQVEPSAGTAGKAVLPVGYGSNVVTGTELPPDFQFGGVDALNKGIVGGILASASTGRRVPGLVLFLLIFVVAAFLLCGREYRQLIQYRIASLIPGRGEHRFGVPSRSGRRKHGGSGYESVGSVARTDGELELGPLETGPGPLPSDSDSDSGDLDSMPVSSPSRKRAAAAASLVRPGSTGASGPVGRAESRERSGQLGSGPSLRSLNVSGGRNGSGSPTRRGSPMVAPYKSSLD